MTKSTSSAASSAEQFPQPSHSNLPKRDIQQNVQEVGNNAIQVGGDYNNQQSFSLNLMISVFFISILALGGLAWALQLGPNQGGINPSQTDQSPNVNQEEVIQGEE